MENKMENKKYYVTSSDNVGPSAPALSERVFIQNKPGITNMSREIKLQGWLGTTNDCAEYAHGEYDTLAEAEAYIAETWPEFTEVEPGEDYDRNLEAYGWLAEYADQREVWTVDGVGDYLYDTIMATTTDAEIEALYADLQSDAARDNAYLDVRKSDLIRYRDSLNG